MKIGILTFHHAYNYGATLQALALARTLASLGADASVIDYRADGLAGASALTRPGELCLTEAPRTLAKAAYRALRHRRFDSFSRSHIPMTPAVSTPSELVSATSDLDAVIVGSDQVFNDDITGADSAFYLDFDGDFSRWSYAASFGGGDERAADVLAAHQESLARFEGISLRERDGIGLFADVLGTPELRHDVDPVFLLEADEWRSLASPRLCREPYVFVYEVASGVNLHSFAADLARKRGLALVDASSSAAFRLHNGPADFLSWICHADVVVTSSFHGTALSLLLGRSLYCDVDRVNGDRTHCDCRISGILEDAGVTGRDIEGPSAPDADPPLDRAAIAARLAALRADSLGYLQRIVSDG